MYRYLHILLLILTLFENKLVSDGNRLAPGKLPHTKPSQTDHGGGGVRKAPKKCHLIFECPLLTKGCTSGRMINFETYFLETKNKDFGD